MYIKSSYNDSICCLGHSEIPSRTYKIWKDWQYLVLSRMWNNENFHKLLVGMLKFARILEYFLIVSNEVKHTLNPWPRTLTLAPLYPGKNENILLQKNLLYKMLIEIFN